MRLRRCLSVLFSEPKIPQLRSSSISTTSEPSFQCSSASRKFLNRLRCATALRVARALSVLFSEPKIPQSLRAAPQGAARRAFQCSSASRKFLNRADRADALLELRLSVLFSEPKIPQFADAKSAPSFRPAFSALQRAENSSISLRPPILCTRRSFQCSSASRKFLNGLANVGGSAKVALSVLFSEPKIPQFYLHTEEFAAVAPFSALQRAENSSIAATVQTASAPRPSFSALQRAENSSMQYAADAADAFQCSSASRKFLN